MHLFCVHIRLLHALSAHARTRAHSRTCAHAYTHTSAHAHKRARLECSPKMQIILNFDDGAPFFKAIISVMIPPSLPPPPLPTPTLPRPPPHLPYRNPLHYPHPRIHSTLFSFPPPSIHTTQLWFRTVRCWDLPLTPRTYVPIFGCSEPSYTPPPYPPPYISLPRCLTRYDSPRTSSSAIRPIHRIIFLHDNATLPLHCAIFRCAVASLTSVPQLLSLTMWIQF